MGKNDEMTILPPMDAELAEAGEHPVEVTEEEAEEGLIMYNEVDDLDDTSNGIDQ